MALPFNPVCFFSFLIPLITAFYFVHGESKLLSNCTKEFSCGDLGFVGFPFAKHTQPHCGLVAVNCDTTPPIVQLGMGGDWYQLKLLFQPFGADYSIYLGDSKLQKPFASHNYSNLNYTIHFQNSPSITFLSLDASILNNFFFKCNDSQADDIGNYERYNCSDGISLYYKRHLPENNPKCDAVKCTLYPSPFIIQQTNDGLTAQFGLRLEVSKTCQECYKGGGQCTEDSKNEFRCAQVTTGNTTTGNSTTGKTTTGNITTWNTPTGNTSKRKPIPIIGALALIVVSMAIILVWQCKEGRKGYSRNTSSDPTSDLERGRSRLFGILVFSYSELEEATGNFHPSKELGDGAFGTVYYGGAKKSNALDMGWSFTCRWCDFEACCSYQEQLLKSLELAIAF
nr:LEAF RUST 10 DISEASE-RESISTANCE LOCUS RECEPTOR-LIKE PROTEIN KINASE-like 1.1 isoform X2 [Ipomoea batatas]